MNAIPIQALPERHLQPHQARQRPPTSFEDLLGDAIERAFGQGQWELDALVAYLNKAARPGPMASRGRPSRSSSS